MMEEKERFDRDAPQEKPSLSANNAVSEPSSRKEMELDSGSAPADASQASNSGSWSWGSFLQKATSEIVDKSSAMVEFMKRDLAEFTDTMQKDTAIIVNDAAQSLKTKTVTEEVGKAAGLVKSGISSFFGSINASLSMFEEQQRADNAAQVHQSRSQARLAAIQNDPNTFQKEPIGRPEDFEAWLLMFDINKMRSEMEHLLDTVEPIQEFYNKFVPLVVTHNEFWQRYFYRIYLLTKDEKRIQSLMARSNDADRTPDDLDWGDDAEEAGAASPSVLLDPSEVCSVVSNESFQMIGHESVGDHASTDPSPITHDAKASSTSGHKKTESSGSSSDWDQITDSPVKHSPPIASTL